LASSPDFVTYQHDNDQLRLERWRRNVGAPIALDLVTSSHRNASVQCLVVLSWNVWIGRGRLREVISRIRDGDFKKHGGDPEAPLVVLAQEAFRSDSTVPATPTGRSGRMLVARLAQQEDIVETARVLGMNLRYAPSMRNGTLPSDRGNAILSTLPLEDAEGIELPLVLQRRVAVSAAIAAGSCRFRVVSAHLDPRGPPGHRWPGAAGRARQAEHLLSALRHNPVILGADLNLGRGRYERAWRILRDAGFSFGIPPSSPTWRHTFHALPRLVLDYILVRDPSGMIEHARVHRLDEHPRDLGPLVFGSDHHPLLARIDFPPGSPRLQ
jgi:endonuclease/exonuclease/phosphatase family metal-dependent hydrolase